MTLKLCSWYKHVRQQKFNQLEKVVLIAPIAIWFSYIPTVHFTENSGANIEISASVAYIIIVALVGLPLVLKNRYTLYNSKLVWLAGLFVSWNVLSVLWSENLVRTILTAGMWLVLYIDFLTIMSLRRLKELVPLMQTIFLVTATIMSGIAIIQVIYGTWFDWGLCRGCVAHGFGFVRPSVFTIEPQFFGNLLLAPIIMIMQRYINRTARHSDGWMMITMLVALYLTLSRGAIFALLIGGVALMFINIKRLHRDVIILPLMVGVGFISGALLHAVCTQFNPRVADGFYDSITKSVNQLTLGVITISSTERHSTSEMIKSAPDPKTSGRGEVPEALTVQPPKAQITGYVEESTNERTKLVRLAKETWQRDGMTMLFGVGSGAAGRALFTQTQQTGGEAEIIQNQYMELLLENGIIGCLFAAAAGVAFMIQTNRHRWVWAIMTAYAVQWLFFSGLPNALHLYLILAVIFATIDKVYE